jgi:phosphatidylserine/phosphatidylglycerophosphate/cardiolipin synthase-like enzyme
MKKLFCWAFLSACLLCTQASAAFVASCTVKFSPNGGIQEEVIKRLGEATTSVDMLAYNYTDESIGLAIRQAHARGVKVRVIIDRTGPKAASGEIPFDKAAGIPVYVDFTYRIAHSKVIIIDKYTVITGSYNWSVSAEKNNSENILFCNSKIMASTYTDRFEYLVTKAKLY